MAIINAHLKEEPIEEPEEEPIEEEPKKKKDKY